MGENYGDWIKGKSRDFRRDEKLKEIVSSIIQEGRMTVNRGKPGMGEGSYPEYVQNALDKIGDEHIGSMIQDNPDFSEKLPGNHQIGGGEDFLLGREGERKKENIRVMNLLIEKNPEMNYQIVANVFLIYPSGEKPKLYVDMFAHRIDIDNYKRAEPDHRGDRLCANCEGRGCWECNFGG